MVPFLKFVSRGRPDSAELALDVVPQALPISIPVGLTFGILALLALALTHRCQHGRLMKLLAGCLAIFSYYVVMYSARRLGLDHTLSAFAAAWTPNVAFLIFRSQSCCSPHDGRTNLRSDDQVPTRKFPAARSG